MSAIEILISDYLSANNHLASDGYANGDAEKLIEAARSESASRLSALRKASAHLQRASRLIPSQSFSEEVAAYAFLARQEISKCERHIHVSSQDGTDICLSCGFDLRDDIHIRDNETAVANG